MSICHEAQDTSHRPTIQASFDGLLDSLAGSLGIIEYPSKYPAVRPLLIDVDIVSPAKKSDALVLIANLQARKARLEGIPA